MCVFLGMYVLCTSQAILSHNKPIIGISVDKLGSVIIRDIDQDYWQYSESHFIKPSWNDKNMYMTDGVSAQHILYKYNKIFTINEGELKEIVTFKEEIKAVIEEKNILHTFTKDTYYRVDADIRDQCKTNVLQSENNINVYNSPEGESVAILSDRIVHVCSGTDVILTTEFTINSSTRLDDNSFLLATDNGLWIYSNTGLKKYYVPGVSLPRRIKNIYNNEGSLWLLTDGEILYNYNFDKQILNRVATDVKDYKLDKWKTLYINKGKHIEVNTNYVNDELPIIAIQEFKNGYQLLDSEVKYDFGNKENDIYVKLNCQYSPGLSKLKYQYKLRNEDRWTNHSSPELYLNDLVPDNYELQLRATSDGQYYTLPRTISFSIKPSLSSSIWPYIFGGLLLLTLLSIISSVSARNQRKKLNAEKLSIAKELSLLKSEQKLGQAQLNPHFLFNALNSIAGMIAMNNNKLARRSLNQFAQLMRMALDNSGEESINIGIEIEFLEKYLSLEQALRDNSFVYRIQDNDIVGTIPPMLIQPIVENAIIHGVAPLKDNKGVIEVIFQEDKKYIIVTVSDNGVGIDVTKNKVEKEYESKAISITESRLKLIDRWGNLDHYIEYRKWNNTSNASSGTSVSIRIAKKRI